MHPCDAPVVYPFLAVEHDNIRTRNLSVILLTGWDANFVILDICMRILSKVMVPTLSVTASTSVVRVVPERFARPLFGMHSHWHFQVAEHRKSCDCTGIAEVAHSLIESVKDCNWIGEILRCARKHETIRDACRSNQKAASILRFP